MPTIDAHDPGTICWIDLASSDAAGAAEFYCELFGWTATRAARGRRRLPHAAARRPPGRRRRAVLGRHRLLGLVDVRRERGCRRDVRRRAGERRGRRDGRHGRAHGGAHGDRARPRRRPGLRLGARRPSRLRGARRPGHAALERAHDPRPHDGLLLLPLRLRLDGRSPRTSAARPTRSGSAATGPSPAPCELDERWPEETQPHWRVAIATADCDATARLCVALGGTVRASPADAAPGRCALLEDPAGAVFSVVAERG